MACPDREILLWVSGALLVVLAVIAWYVATAPGVDLVPEQYRFGVL